MTLDDPAARTQETLAAGLVKGETACNRSACQSPLNAKDGSRWWNTETQAFYCMYCAMRINESSKVSLGREICITESEKFMRENRDTLGKIYEKRNSL